MEEDLKIIKVEYVSKRWSDPPQILDLCSWDQNKIKMPEMNTTSNGRRPQKLKSWISQQPLIGSSSNLKHKFRGTKPKSKMLEMKTMSNGRWPQNIKGWISQQPLIGSFSYFRSRLRGPNQNQTFKNGGELQWKIQNINVEYLSNHWSDVLQIWNISSGVPTKIKKAWNEHDLQWKTTSKY